jgi:hypothetical protein
VPGYGPIPAAIACRLAADAAGDERSKDTLRRLYRHPASGAMVAMESRARLFPEGLARYIAIRDDTCRTPYCDAPIRHTDHATAHGAGDKPPSSTVRAPAKPAITPSKHPAGGSAPAATATAPTPPTSPPQPGPDTDPRPHHWSDLRDRDRA